MSNPDLIDQIHFNEICLALACAQVQILSRLARGRMIPDPFTILGAMDLVLADVDR
jgi:NADH:ubiquinone oxidoreductase subunit D